MKHGMGGGAWRWEALTLESSARAECAFRRAQPSTLLESPANQRAARIFSTKKSNTLQKPCKFSGWAAVYGLRSGSIREKIIGHSMGSIFAGFGGGEQIRDS